MGFVPIVPPILTVSTTPIHPMTPESWDQAREAIARGALVAFPTDTVYGVACDPRNVAAIERLYAVKGRVREKAIPLLLSSVRRIEEVARDVPDAARVLGDAFWPGGLTLIVPRAPGLPQELGGGATIAVRVPDHAELCAFLESCGGALATSSANLSGQPDALTAEQVVAYFGDLVNVIVDGGATRGGIPSTVVDCTPVTPAILREGAIPRAQIEQALTDE